MDSLTSTPECATRPARPTVPARHGRNPACQPVGSPATAACPSRSIPALDRRRMGTGNRHRKPPRYREEPCRPPADTRRPIGARTARWHPGTEPVARTLHSQRDWALLRAIAPDHGRILRSVVEFGGRSSSSRSAASPATCPSKASSIRATKGNRTVRGPPDTVCNPTQPRPA